MSRGSASATDFRTHVRFTILAVLAIPAILAIHQPPPSSQDLKDLAESSQSIPGLGFDFPPCSFVSFVVNGFAFG